MKIAHISDLHINTAMAKTNIDRTAFLLDYVSEQNFDHLVVTGDISDNTREADLEKFRELLEERDLYSTEKTSVVIGNHDIFGGLEVVDDIFNFPEKCAAVNFQEKTRWFQHHLNRLFENTYNFTDNCYPFAKILNNILFIGFNSNAYYSGVYNPFASNGHISSEQLTAAEALLEKYGKYARHKIVLVHHHFNKFGEKSGTFVKSVWNKIERQTMKLRKKKRILKVFKERGIDLVLHGHFHKSESYTRRKIPFMNAGASVKNETPGFLYLNKITISHSKIDTEVIPFHFTENKKLLPPAGTTDRPIKRESVKT